MQATAVPFLVSDMALLLLAFFLPVQAEQFDFISTLLTSTGPPDLIVSIESFLPPTRRTRV